MERREAGSDAEARAGEGAPRHGEDGAAGVVRQEEVLEGREPLPEERDELEPVAERDGGRERNRTGTLHEEARVARPALLDDEEAPRPDEELGGREEVDEPGAPPHRAIPGG